MKENNQQPPLIAVVFDLDDTLYKEADFVESAFDAIGKAWHEAGGGSAREVSDAMREAFARGENPIDAVKDGCAPLLGEQQMVGIYRFHKPAISLDAETEDMLSRLHDDSRVVTGLITDGRSLTQRNKIAALGLERFFAATDMLVSEECGHDKTEPCNFMKFAALHPQVPVFLYVGDNPGKDFYHPNRLGWTTVCLKDNGRNIHPQRLDAVDECHRPRILVEHPAALLEIVNHIITEYIHGRY